MINLFDKLKQKKLLHHKNTLFFSINKKKNSITEAMLLKQNYQKFNFK